KCAPVSRQTLRQIFRTDIIAVLNCERRSELRPPGDPDGVDLFRLAEVDHHPLRVNRIFLAGEMLIEVGITLPKCLQVAVIYARVAIVVSLIDRVAAARQTISVTSFYRRRRRTG